MLSDRDRTILEIEGKAWKYQAVKEQVIVDQLGMTPTRYYQALLALVEAPEAWELAPSTMKRVQGASGILLGPSDPGEHHDRPARH